MVSTSLGLEGAGRQFHDPADEIVQDRALLQQGGKGTGRSLTWVQKQQHCGRPEVGDGSQVGEDEASIALKALTPKSVVVELCPDLTSSGTGLSLNIHTFPPSP